MNTTNRKQAVRVLSSRGGIALAAGVVALAASLVSVQAVAGDGDFERSAVCDIRDECSSPSTPWVLPEEVRPARASIRFREFTAEVRCEIRDECSSRLSDTTARVPEAPAPVADAKDVASPSSK